MIALVDYDNLERRDQARGLVNLADRVLSAVGPESIRAGRALSIRLYGGWFEGDAASRHALDLEPEIQRDFPRPLGAKDEAGNVVQVTVRMELARTLACDPLTPLTHTYRRRSLPYGLRCKPMPPQGCTALSGCPLIPFGVMLRQEECPQGGCLVRPGDVLERAEQKLVDSMLTVDLLFLISRNGARELCLVSADDDMWPGIRTALLTGASVVHVCPKRTLAAPEHYRALAVGNYRHIPF